MSTTQHPEAAGPTVIHDYSNVGDAEFPEHTDDRHCPCGTTRTQRGGYIIHVHQPIPKVDEEEA